MIGATQIPIPGALLPLLAKGTAYGHFAYPAAHALLAWCYEWRYARGGYAEADRQQALVHALVDLHPGGIVEGLFS